MPKITLAIALIFHLQMQVILKINEKLQLIHLLMIKWIRNKRLIKKLTKKCLVILPDIKGLQHQAAGLVKTVFLN
jgi:hypothetical protein